MLDSLQEKFNRLSNFHQRDDRRVDITKKWWMDLMTLVSNVYTSFVGVNNFPQGWGYNTHYLYNKGLRRTFGTTTFPAFPAMQEEEVRKRKLQVMSPEQLREDVTMKGVLGPGQDEKAVESSQSATVESLPEIQTPPAVVQAMGARPKRVASATVSKLESSDSESEDEPQVLAGTSQEVPMETEESSKPTEAPPVGGSPCLSQVERDRIMGHLDKFIRYGPKFHSSRALKRIDWFEQLPVSHLLRTDKDWVDSYTHLTFESTIRDVLLALVDIPSAHPGKSLPSISTANIGCINAKTEKRHKAYVEDEVKPGNSGTCFINTNCKWEGDLQCLWDHPDYFILWLRKFLEVNS